MWEKPPKRSNLLFTQSCNSVDNLLTACLYSSKLSSGYFSTNYEDILSEVGAIWKERCCSRLTERFLSLQDPFYHKVVICQQIYLERILRGFLNVFNHYSNYLFSTLRVVMQCIVKPVSYVAKGQLFSTTLFNVAVKSATVLLCKLVKKIVYFMYPFHNNNIPYINDFIKLLGNLIVSVFYDEFLLAKSRIFGENESEVCHGYL